ncbi:MAG: sensor histidine kinase [Firmicutes bacterium]|nr:sensor histidine kinase [Bacillota bacterium]
MKKRWDFSQQTRGVWLVACILIVVVTTVCSIVIYVQVSRNLTKQIRRGLFWEAKLYREQLEQIFYQIGTGLDGIVNSQGAKDGNSEVVQKNLYDLKECVPSIGRSWMIYDSGQLIPSYDTRYDYLDQLQWWQTYLSGDSLRYLGYPLGKSQAVMGRPYLGENGLSTMVPLMRFAFRNSKITRLVVAEVDIGHALVESSEWSKNPVSLYAADGHLLARPYSYDTKESEVLADHCDDPLMQLQIDMPREEMGFAFFERGNEKRAGVFLRVPSVGMIITVERSAQEVLKPVRYIAGGSLVAAILSVIVATMLVYTLYNAYRKLQEAEQLALSAEFRALQANINPHFLFNTLDRMVGKAVTSNNRDIVDMLRALADLFRYTVSRPNHLVTVEEELKYLQRYVYLQQRRYGDRFEYSLKVDEELLGAQIPKFTIQPVVENCFVHAVEKSMDLVNIEVHIQDEGNVVKISVLDDGPGIGVRREQEINLILEGDASGRNVTAKGLGLSNIHKRLQHLYGRQYGLVIQRLERGLRVQITLPIVYESTDGVP